MFGYVVRGRIGNEIVPRQYVVLALNIDDARKLYERNGVAFDLIDEFVPTTSKDRMELMEKNPRTIIRLGDVDAEEAENRKDTIVKPPHTTLKEAERRDSTVTRAPKDVRRALERLKPEDMQ